MTDTMNNKKQSRVVYAGSADPNNPEKLITISDLDFRDYDRISGLFLVNEISYSRLLIQSRAGEYFFMKFRGSGGDFPKHLRKVLENILEQHNNSNPTYILLDAKLKQPSKKRARYTSKFPPYYIRPKGVKGYSTSGYKLLTSGATIEIYKP